MVVGIVSRVRPLFVCCKLNGGREKGNVNLLHCPMNFFPAVSGSSHWCRADCTNLPFGQKKHCSTKSWSAKNKRINYLIEYVPFFCTLHPSFSTLFSSFCEMMKLLCSYGHSVYFSFSLNVPHWFLSIHYELPNFDLQTEKKERKRVLLLCCTTLCAFFPTQCNIKECRKRSIQIRCSLLCYCVTLRFGFFPTVDPSLSFQHICFWYLFYLLILEILCVKRTTIEWMPRLNIAQYKCSEGHINPETTVAINLTNYLTEHISNWMSFGLIAFWSVVYKEQTEKEKNILNKQNKKTQWITTWK